MGLRFRSSPHVSPRTAEEESLTMDTVEGTERYVVSFDVGELVREDRIHRRIYADSDIFEPEMHNILRVCLGSGFGLHVRIATRSLSKRAKLVCLAA